MIMIRKMTNAVLISMLTCAMAILISGCSNNSTPQSTKSTSASTNTQAASFYKTDLDGTEVEIVALKDSKGNLRTAFNACQVCYSSGRGYYRQEGEYLVCQNCGNSFTIDQVGIASGGCNPWPILDSDRTVTDDEIQISYDVLKATADELPKFFQ